MIEQARMGPAGAYLCQVLFQGSDAFAHAFARVLFDFL
jgi:hypothetical protein